MYTVHTYSCAAAAAGIDACGYWLLKLNAGREHNAVTSICCWFRYYQYLRDEPIWIDWFFLLFFFLFSLLFLLCHFACRFVFRKETMEYAGQPAQSRVNACICMCMNICWCCMCYRWFSINPCTILSVNVNHHWSVVFSSQNPKTISHKQCHAKHIKPERFCGWVRQSYHYSAWFILNTAIWI